MNPDLTMLSKLPFVSYKRLKFRSFNAANLNECVNTKVILYFLLLML